MEEPESLRQKVGPVVIGLLCFIPAMIVSGFMPDWDVLEPWQWAALSTAGGALGGALLAEGRAVTGAVAGLVSGALVIPLVVWYVDMRAGLGSTYFSIEFLIPGLVAFLPGWGLYTLAERLWPSTPEPSA